MNAEQRIRYALEFSQTNLRRVFSRPKREAEFRAAFSQFFYPSKSLPERASERGGFHSLANPNFISWKEQDFENLQSDVRGMLHGIVSPNSPAPPIIQQLSLSANFYFMRFGKEAIPMISGDAREVFLLTLWFLLSSGMGNRIATCGDPKCGRLFYRQTARAKFCCRNCAVRVNMRKLRTRHLPSR